MTQITYEVDKADLKRVKKKLKNVRQKTPATLKNAINRTATKVKKTLVQQAQTSYTLKKKGYGKDIKIQRASVAHLDATIKASGMPRTLASYKYSAPKSGAKADIVKSGLKEIAKKGSGGKAFLGKGGKIAGLVVQRESKDRNSISVLHSVSVPKMIEQVYKGKRGGLGNLQPKVQETLHDEISKEIQKVIGR